MSRIKGKFAKSYDRFIRRESHLPTGLLKLVRSFNPRDILEFGCGTGSVAVGLGLAGFEVTGVDISNDMLKEARQKIGKSKIDVRFKRANIVDIDLKRKFDLLLCLGNTVPLIYGLKDARRLFRNFARHLNPGGSIVIQQLNYDRILMERPRTFAVDRYENQIRIKQYKYGKRLIDFAVSLIDYSMVPPQIHTSQSKIRPWLKSNLISELTDAGFYKLSSFGDHKKSRLGRKSRDLIIIGKLRLHD
jgi:2-polyprenyl-3-methyl-5-hydroxy-6-metoxy-1,4-benzoquinol methylase